MPLLFFARPDPAAASFCRGFAFKWAFAAKNANRAACIFRSLHKRCGRAADVVALGTRGFDFTKQLRGYALFSAVSRLSLARMVVARCDQNFRLNDWLSSLIISCFNAFVSIVVCIVYIIFYIVLKAD